MNGIDVYANRSTDELCNYNLIVYDCGSARSCEGKSDIFNQSDSAFLCCRIGWKELHLVTMSHSCLNGFRYTAVVSAYAEACEVYRDILSGNLNEYVAVDFRDYESVGRLVYGG